MPANDDADQAVTPGEVAGGTGSGAAHDFKTFEEFWPYYVAMHSQPATRLVHTVGTITAGLVAVSAVLRFRPKMKRLLLAPIVGYGAAWGAHFLIERNNPATFGYPAWSFQGDIQMLKMFLEGRDDELSEIAERWLEDHPEDRSPGSLVASDVAEV